MGKWHRESRVDVRELLVFEVWSAEQDSSHMCDSWYYPIYLLSDISLTFYMTYVYVYGIFDGPGKVI